MDNRRTIPGYKYFLEPGGGRPDVFVAFLDAVPEPGARVAGLAFPVDAAALGELDARERNYRARGRDGAGRRGPRRRASGRTWGWRRRASASRRARGRGTAVVSRAYVEGVRAGFAAYGLELRHASRSCRCGI